MSDETALVLADDPRELMPASMGRTFAAYRSLQAEIDRAMPDQIMQIQGRQFRKKGYWRAVRAAFKLQVECMSEQRVERDGDWGYQALYRASGGGSTADGDGTCMASEKAERQRSEHNVRSHAHTRAFNRAVSNLVGFGEVSAEEMTRDEHEAPPVTVPRPTPAQAAAHRQAVQQAVQKVADAHVMDGPSNFYDPERNVTDDGAITAADVPPYAGLCKITKVKALKTGTNKNGPWTLWVIGCDDRREGTTFSNEMAVAAEDAMQAGAYVEVTFIPSDRDPSKMVVSSLLKAAS